MISIHLAKALVVRLRSAVRHLREAQSVAHAVAPPYMLTDIVALWGATATARGMLLAIWERYPVLDDRDGTEDEVDWQLDKFVWEWATAWDWGTVTRRRLLFALKQANHFLALAAADVSTSDTPGRGRFEAVLSDTVGVVRTARTTFRARW